VHVISHMHGCIVIGMYMCVDMYTAIYRQHTVVAQQLLLLLLQAAMQHCSSIMLRPQQVA
jgi:hypothetical protein